MHRRLVLVILRTCTAIASLSPLAHLLCSAAKFNTVKESADDFEANRVDGKKFSLMLPEEPAVTVSMVEFKAAKEESAGKEITLLFDSTLLFSVTQPNKWKVNAGDYSVPLHNCLVIVPTLKEFLAVYSLGCIKAMACSPATAGASLKPEQQAACTAMATDLYTSYIFKQLQNIAGLIRAYSNGLIRQAQYTSIPRKRDWIEWQYFSKPTDDLDEIRTWTIQSAQLVIMTKDRKGKEQKHVGVKLSTSAKDSTGKPVDLLAHMIEDKGERITGYDPKYYGTVLADITVDVTDGKKPTLGAMFDCVGGKGLLRLGMCALYANRVLLYLTGDLKSCEEIGKMAEVRKFKDAAIDRVVVKEEAVSKVDLGNVGVLLLQALRKQ